MREHTNEILLLHIKKGKSDVFYEEETNIKQFKNKSGVWAMWGKDSSSTNICLEVGQTKNIFEELEYDLSYLKRDYSKENKSKRYTARKLLEFNKNFNVCKCDLSRTCAKYRVIASNYSDIHVYLICNSNETKEERESIELKYAIDNEAIYWNAWGKQRRDAKKYFEEKQLI